MVLHGLLTSSDQTAYLDESLVHLTLVYWFDRVWLHGSQPTGLVNQKRGNRAPYTHKTRSLQRYKIKRHGCPGVIPRCFGQVPGSHLHFAWHVLKQAGFPGKLLLDGPS